MSSYLSFNGKILPRNEFSLEYNDLGLLRGYGIFDYFRTQDNIPLFIEDHLDRFFSSAEKLRLAVPFSREQIVSQVEELIRLNEMPQSGIRLVLTGGYSLDSFTIGPPNLILIQEAISMTSELLVNEGVKLITHEYVRDIPEVKTTNYLMAIWLQDRIKKMNAFDVLYQNNGVISEVSRSNFFIVNNKGVIVTPNKGILLGVTRKNVLGLARKKIKVEERTLQMEELNTAKEAFLTGSTKRIIPVVQVDDMKIGNGTPGEYALELLSDLRKFESDYKSKRA